MLPVASSERSLTAIDFVVRIILRQKSSRAQPAIFLLHPAPQTKSKRAGTAPSVLSSGATHSFSAGINSAPRAKSMAASNHANAMKPSNPVQNQCNCEFPPARVERTRYAITLHVALCFHRRRRTPGSRAWPLVCAGWDGASARWSRAPRPLPALRFARSAQESPFATLTREVMDADVILLLTPDDVLADVARQLARACGQKVPRQNRVARQRRVGQFGPASHSRDAARLTGSIHPMQTFTNNSQPNLKGVIFAIEGDPRARRAAAAIARSLGGIPVLGRQAAASPPITRPGRW